MIGRLNHVAIAVKDLEASTALYRDTLGARVSQPQPEPEHGVTVVFVELPNTKIELLEPLGADSPIAKFLERNGQGMQQLAFRVDDVEHVADVLRSRGLRLLYDAPRRGTSDSRVNFIHPKDAGGVLVELVEPAAHPH